MPETTMTVPRTSQGVRDLDQVRGPVLPLSGGRAPQAGSGQNMGSADRVACTVGGGALLLLGLAHGSLPGLGLAALAGSLLYSGISGYCPMYAALGWNTAGDTGPGAEVVYRPR